MSARSGRSIEAFRGVRKEIGQSFMQGFLIHSLLRAAAVVLDDRARLPWRFLARHIAIDGLVSG